MQRIRETMEIQAPLAVCYRLWAQFESFPQFMKQVESVQYMPERDVWHWVVRGPWGQRLKWDAKVDVMFENKAISWHTIGPSRVYHSGTVSFIAEGPDRTQVEVKMAFEPEYGKLGEWVTDVVKNPAQMVASALNAFKHHVLRQLPTMQMSA